MEKRYSLIIIGGGITGLSTALAWAKTHDCQKEPVLLLEKEPKTGGCVTTFARKGYRFDTVQIIPDVSDVLKFFNLDQDLELVPYSGHYARLFLADSEKKQCSVYPIASSEAEFESWLCEKFPDEKNRIGDFFRYGRKLLEELEELKTEPTILQGINILIKCPHIIKQSGRTYREYLDSFHFNDSQLIEILDTFSSFSGLSGNRCAALLTACAMMTTLRGSYRPPRGFIHFPKSMSDRLIGLGGEILTSTEADSILTDKGNVKGVKCGETIYLSDYVVSTVDTFKTVSMLPQSLTSTKKGWFGKVKKAQPSPSSFTIHLGLDDEVDMKSLGFDCGYNVLTTGRSTHEKCFDAWQKGEMLGDDKEFHMAVISPSAITGGKQNLIIHVTPAPMADWDDLRNSDYKAYEIKKKKTADFYIYKVEEYMIPQLKQHIELIDISTPATYKRYLGTTEGANSQMLSVPGNFGMFRLPTRTPVKGLFLPKFSHGIWPCLQAGLQTVDMIMGGSIMDGNSRYVHKDSFNKYQY